MTSRLDYQAVSPESTRGLTEIARFVRRGSLAPKLLELVKVRASQINGCAYCLAIHVPRARRFGATAEQLDTLAGWPDSTVFSGAERAALAWTESVTLLIPGRVPDADWDGVRREFTDAQIVELTMAIVEINAWNRLQVAFRRPPEFEEPAGTVPPPSAGAPPA